MRVPNHLPLYADGRDYDAHNHGVRDDIPFYLRLARMFGGPILELGCGTGRVSIPLAKEGHRVTGLDLSLPMLLEAHRKARLEGVKVALLQSDCRRFALKASFRLVLFPFNAIVHLLDRESLEACLACVRRHLAPDGRFVLDTFNPDLSFLVRSPADRFPLVEYDDPHGRGRVVVTEQSSYDRASQLNHVVWRYEIGGVPDARVACFTMRLLFPQELDALLWYNGFEVEHKYGDYRMEPFSSSSRKQLVVARPRGSCAPTA